MSFSLKREIHYLSGMLRMLRSVKTVDATSNHLLADELEMRIDSYGPNIAFIEDDRQWSFDDVEIYANRVAQWALAQGLKPKDPVAIFVRNRLEYVALWLGMCKVGVVPALLNFQLSGKSLA